MIHEEKIVWVEDVDGYKLQIMLIEEKYLVPVYYAVALQKGHDGGWFEVWGTQFLDTEEGAREAVREAWRV